MLLYLMEGIYAFVAITVIGCCYFSIYIGLFLRPMAISLYLASVLIGIGAAGESSHLRNMFIRANLFLVCMTLTFCRHRSVPVPCENGSAETTVAEGGPNLVAGLWNQN